jgi:hypothetical protein
LATLLSVDSRWVTCSADLKRRITSLRVLIADCDRMAAALDNEVRDEENRVKIYDPADVAYSIYAKASGSRRDNLRRSANELRAHLAEAEKAAWTAVQPAGRSKAAGSGGRSSWPIRGQFQLIDGDGVFVGAEREPEDRGD